MRKLIFSVQRIRYKVGVLSTAALNDEMAASLHKVQFVLLKQNPQSFLQDEQQRGKHFKGWVTLWDFHVPRKDNYHITVP